MAFDSPARQSLVPNLVPARDLSNAFSLTSIAFQIGSIIGPALSGAVIMFGLATNGFGLARTVPLVMAALILIGASDSVSTIIRNTIRQLQTPDYIRGRMVSVNQIFFVGGPQSGEIEAGLAAQIFSAPIAVISGDIGCILAVSWIARRWTSLRAYNGDEPVLAGAKAG